MRYVNIYKDIKKSYIESQGLMSERYNAQCWHFLERWQSAGPLAASLSAIGHKKDFKEG